MSKLPGTMPPLKSPNPWLARLTSGHEVHLWYVMPERISDETQLAAFRDLLSDSERARNARYVFAQGRHDDLIARALVRTSLSRYHPTVDPRAWQFEAGPFGRPEIVGPPCTPGLSFNLSHTSGLIVCLVAVEREIGVDVEDTSRISLSEIDIADRYFSPSEVAELRSLPAEAQSDRFFDYWTLKEAYIKARGLGLQLPLDQFSLRLDDGRPIRISFGPEIADDPASWQLELRSLTPRHRLAMAIRRRQEPDLMVRVWPARRLGDIRPAPGIS